MREITVYGVDNDPETTEMLQLVVGLVKNGDSVIYQEHDGPAYAVVRQAANYDPVN